MERPYNPLMSRCEFRIDLDSVLLNAILKGIS